MNTSSNVNNTKDVQPSKSRENSADPQQRYGASAYIDQSEYDSYKQPIKQQEIAYSNYPQNDNQKTRQVYNQDDDYSTNQQQQYMKPSSTLYPGYLGRSNTNEGLQSTQGQPRITSAKQRNISSGSTVYQVIISRKNKRSKKIELNF